MSDFEKSLMQHIKGKVLKEIQNTSFIKTDYGNQKELPRDFINKVWDEVDWDLVISSVKNNLETRICNSIVASMETEVKTDIKKIIVCGWGKAKTKNGSLSQINEGFE